MKKLNIIGRFNVLKVPQTTCRLCKDAVLLALFVSMLMLPFLEVAAQTGEKKPYSPYVGRDYPTNVYFGDTHLHTRLSLDAYGDGNTRLGPSEAYRWAKGETLAGDDGVMTRISRPLDFLMVADHGEYMGLVPALAEGNEQLRATKEGGRWGKMIDEGKLTSEVFGEFIVDATSNKPRLVEPEFEMSVWNEIIDAAEAHYEPGKFTTFIGYEYSPFPDGDNLHRVVVFKDGKSKAGQVKPFSAFDSEDPEDLWAWLQAYEDKTGGRVLAIPHNGNLSGGNMFALQTFEGKPLTREYAKTRMRWEPLYEVTQYKGDSETHPYLSPNDEFADFERWDKANLAMLKPHKDEFFKYEYARPALILGLDQESKLGINPFKFGMIGSTDSHTSFAQASEDNFLGKYGSASPNPERWHKEWPPVPGVVATMKGWESSSSGYAAVWATENTREAIWDAMKRKEVYATTGPRMLVRMFGGFDYTNEDAFSNDYVAIGYNKGVPMGSDLSNAPKGKNPTFIIAAIKDPDGANLDRIQIVKGWLSKDGELHEKIYDVAVSDGRKVVNGKATKQVGSTVDLKTATYSNSIGDAQLIAYWKDPDFNPSEKSFYYTRVIEIPTPRWPAYDEVRFDIKMDPEVTRVLQERAYTSPIWYTP
jgi:hypothetical protein